ncbi:MAG: TIGR04282 family arsenosugar biosynthesis glycosyltransferase [Verrucomicrobia bacterium]|nr:TIGR04282 family arsenosugar biosynthesis glycosyltransferase [Verrucomicrobiota bacterium]
MSTHASRLVVFLKAPRPGSVKTRLAETLGADAACAAYRQLVEALLANLAPLQAVELCFAPADASAEINPWLRTDWSACPQSEGDLGERLHAAFTEHFLSDAEHVVIIGSDCPAVTPTDISDAWLALDGHDVVLGPALDGGYWLIGLRAPQPNLFTGMPWSTDAVFGETTRRARESGLRIATLRELSDVDTVADWERWVKRAVREINPT